ncbi:MIZ zinc finger protein [Paraphaeosphaeria sporulosa]
MPRGGRAVGAPPAAAEDVDIRVTLRYALGNLGGRQRRWITLGQPPSIGSSLLADAPRHRGRPRQYRQEYEPVRQAPVGEPVREQLASNSTSPQLANVLSHTPNGRPANKRIRLSLFAQRRSAPAPLRTSSVSIDHQDLGKRVLAGQLQSASPTASQPFGAVPRQPSNSQSPFQSPYQAPLPQQQVAPQRVPSQTRVHIQNVPTPPVQSPLDPPRQSLFASQNAQANHAGTPAGPQRQTDLRAHSLQAIEDFNSLNDLQQDFSDRKRLTALKLAARQMDWDYLITHLFYCLLTLSKAALPDSIRNSPLVGRTEQFLSEVLGVNTGLTPATKAFFVRYPLPLHEWALLNPAQYLIDVENFNDLMNQSANYFALKSQCDERDLPPSIHELVLDLGIRSRQLQSIIFTASVRRLWFKSGLHPGNILNSYENEVLQYFSTTQETFYRRLHQAYGTHEGRDIELRSWVGIFMDLRSSYVPLARDALHSMQASHQVPVLASQHYPARSSLPQQPLRMSSGHNGQFLLIQQLVYPDPRPSPPSAHPAIQRPRLPTQQPQPQPQPQAPVHPWPLSERPILPPRHYRPQQHMPNPVRFGLHQAYFRSPTLHSKTGERLYSYAQSIIGIPQRLVDARNKIERWTFSLSSEQMAKIPRNVAETAGSPPFRVVDEDNLMLRLRCVKWNVAEGLDEHRWATSATSWIPYSYFKLNKHPLEQRKKLHHEKDLPINLTSLVKEGENVLEIGLVRRPENERFRDYLLAIEILGVRPHKALMEDILTNNHVSALLTKQRIKDKLTGTTDDDDEIAVVNSTLNIALFDPFSRSEICNIPVRSKACDHFDCFDLETFLKTRKRNADSTGPANWKCPICNGDARPHHLVVDGFMQEVRSELEKQGLLKTRAIIMSEDGSWKPKPEIMEGVADHDDDDAPANSSGQNTPVPQATEVNDLGYSDDD